MAEYTCDHCGKSLSSKQAVNQHKSAKGHPSPKAARVKEKLRKQPARGGRPQWLWLALGGAAILIAAVVMVTLRWPGSPQATLEARPLPAHGDQSMLRDVQSFPEEGLQHVAQGMPIEYGTSPPTSGSHYPHATPAGFYTETPPLGNLVHSLEHGAVVIYYHSRGLSAETEQSLRAFVQAHRNPWASVVVAPNPEPDPQFPYILTAWTKMLKMKEYDVKVVRAFLAEYLGRGPENPVR